MPAIIPREQLLAEGAAYIAMALDSEVQRIGKLIADGSVVPH
jgi:hypothetical protein